MEKYIPEKALCTIKEVEAEWNITQSPTNNNVQRNYIKNERKNKQYKIIDMGAYCVKHNITPDMMRLFVEYGAKLTALLVGDKKNKDNKVVVMSEEDYKTYELFKKMKAFNEAQK